MMMMDESPVSTVAAEEAGEYRKHEFVEEPLQSGSSTPVVVGDCRSYVTVHMNGGDKDRVTLWTTPTQPREPALKQFANDVLGGEGDAEDRTSSD